MNRTTVKGLFRALESIRAVRAQIEEKVRQSSYFSPADGRKRIGDDISLDSHSYVILAEEAILETLRDCVTEVELSPNLQLALRLIKEDKKEVLVKALGELM